MVLILNVSWIIIQAYKHRFGPFVRSVGRELVCSFVYSLNFVWLPETAGRRIRRDSKLVYCETIWLEEMFFRKLFRRKCRLFMVVRVLLEINFPVQWNGGIRAILCVAGPSKKKKKIKNPPCISAWCKKALGGLETTRR